MLDDISYKILFIHSVIYFIFSSLILINQKESINYSFGILGKQKGRIDNSLDKVLSYQYSLAMLSFAIPGIYFSSAKKYNFNVFIYPLILYHFLPIFLSIKNANFYKAFRGLTRWHLFNLVILIFSLFKKK